MMENKKDEILVKQSPCYALLSNKLHPGVFILVKAKVVDYILDKDGIGYYTIKLVHFYDSIPFLKKYYHKSSISCMNKPVRGYISSKIKYKDQLNEYTKNIKTTFCINEMFVFKERQTMFNYFDSILEFYFVQKLKELKINHARHIEDKIISPFTFTIFELNNIIEYILKDRLPPEKIHKIIKNI